MKDKRNAMKSVLIKALVVVLLAMGIGNYLIYLKTGQMPAMALRDKLSADGFSHLFSSLSVNEMAADTRAAAARVVNQLTPDEPMTEQKVYKWTDAEGRIHFSDKPLVDSAQQIKVDTRKSISDPEPGLLSKTKALLDAQKYGAAGAGDTAAAELSPLEKAKAAAEAMNARTLQQEQAY
jgi:hypothetical protein